MEARLHAFDGSVTKVEVATFPLQPRLLVTQGYVEYIVDNPGFANFDGVEYMDYREATSVFVPV